MMIRKMSVFNGEVVLAVIKHTNNLFKYLFFSEVRNEFGLNMLIFNVIDNLVNK